MVSSAWRISFCFLLILGALGAASSQTNPEKNATASISGKVTLKNKGLAGIVVFAFRQNVARSESYHGTADQNGNYRISNLPAGIYVVIPLAPSLASQDEVGNDSVVISEGENVDGINFSMVQGGVITGKISDADGRPLIEAQVEVSPVDSQFVGRRLGFVNTDDRGIYRAFGLRPGKYRVSVGRDDYISNAAFSYRKTFYPSVTDPEKAKLIEVTEGSETKDVDILVGRPLSAFKVSGRIMDRETGKPLPNIKYGLFQNLSENSSSSTVGRNFSNIRGEFNFDNVLPGKYRVFIVPEETGVRGDSVAFEVVDHDVTDLVINAGKAGSLSGFVVFEGAERSTKTNDLLIHAWVDNQDMYTGGTVYPINADGSFRVGGLQNGSVRLHLSPRTRNDQKPIAIVRVERDGVPQTSDLILKDGEQVTGLRIVVKYLTGAIHGEVKVEGDEISPDARLSLWLNPVDANRTLYQSTSGNSSPRIDSRRRFVVEGLAAGTYELNVAVYEPGRAETNQVYKQQVTVSDNAVSEVIFTIKTKP